MCRLLGYVARTPTTIAAVVGEQDIHDFTALSHKHRDGWGVAWASDDAVHVRKAAEAARRSDTFARHARDHRSDIGMVHLRWATLGFPVTAENAHPFTDGRYAFAHNGSIIPPSDLGRLIPEHVQARRRGDTDSEQYFLALLARLEDTDLVQAVADTVSEIANNCAFSSLNCVLLTPEVLVAVCRYDKSQATADEDPEYFNLRYRIRAGSVVVASSGWGTGWQELNNGEMLVAHRHSLDTEIRWISDIEVAR